MDAEKVTYHGEWEHFTPQTLTKSLRFCLAKELAPPKDPFQGLPASPERVQKNIAKETDQRREKMLELGEDCGKKFGSWWGVTLVKKVQAIRHMCGEPSALSAGRPTPADAKGPPADANGKGMVAVSLVTAALEPLAWHVSPRTLSRLLRVSASTQAAAHARKLAKTDMSPPSGAPFA